MFPIEKASEKKSNIIIFVFFKLYLFISNIYIENTLRLRTNCIENRLYIHIENTYVDLVTSIYN